MPDSRKRVVVGEDDADIRLLLSMYCGIYPSLELVGAVDTHTAVVELARSAAPDVVIVNHSLPSDEGEAPDLARRLAELRGAATGAVIVMFSDDSTLKDEAEAAGADLFVVKGDISALFTDIISTLGSDARSRRLPRPEEPLG